MFPVSIEYEHAIVGTCIDMNMLSKKLSIEQKMHKER